MAPPNCHETAPGWGETTPPRLRYGSEDGEVDDLLAPCDTGEITVRALCRVCGTDKHMDAVCSCIGVTCRDPTASRGSVGGECQGATSPSWPSPLRGTFLPEAKTGAVVPLQGGGPFTEKGNPQQLRTTIGTELAVPLLATRTLFPALAPGEYPCAVELKRMPSTTPMEGAFARCCCCCCLCCGWEQLARDTALSTTPATMCGV